jgi:hypothetical protein
MDPDPAEVMPKACLHGRPGVGLQRLATAGERLLDILLSAGGHIRPSGRNSFGPEQPFFFPVLEAA